MVVRLTSVLFGLVTAAALPSHAAQLRAYAGVVAGNAQGTGSIFACATSGPTIGNGWFAGVAIPTEGFSGCNLAGGIDDHVAASGPLTASQTGTAPMVSGLGTYTGSAQARADYWSVGVSTEGTATGGTSSSTYHQAAAFASFTDTLTLRKTGIATGTAGSTDFTFLVEGAMQSLSHSPYAQQADVRLGIRVNGRYIWDSFMATTYGSADTPYVRGGATGLPGSFAIGPGSLSGSALVTSTANFDIQWGVPFTVEVALLSSAYPCCHGASNSADFLNTALLKGIVARGPGGEVTGFDVLAESGAKLGPQGLMATVPEPSTWSLMVAGLAFSAWRIRRRQPAARRYRPAR
ncbi:PEP-CTERM sorting domain-containing protein [Aquabacterium sp.]|uniref:PEP-CTERM sorting domain-containing protein n=1 Tax=Aquabacterium sp. TaxID=1872578 RepID=UPI003D6C8384